MKTMILSIVLLTSLSIFCQDLGREEAVKWARKHGFIVSGTFDDGRDVLLIGVKNGIPQYIATEDSDFRADSSATNIVGLSKKCKYPIDTLFADGSRAHLQSIKEGKPIYLISNKVK